MIDKIKNQQFENVNIKSALSELEDWEWEKDKICLCCGEYTGNLSIHIKSRHGKLEKYIEYFDLPEGLVKHYVPIDHGIYDDMEEYLDRLCLVETDDEDAYQYVQLPNNKQVKVKHKPNE